MSAAFDFRLSLHVAHQVKPAHAKKVKSINGNVMARNRFKASEEKIFTGLPVPFVGWNRTMSVLISVYQGISPSSACSSRGPTHRDECAGKEKTG